MDDIVKSWTAGTFGFDELTLRDRGGFHCYTLRNIDGEFVWWLLRSFEIFHNLDWKVNY